jgi:ubiquinone/menaquinone biosynthesis C-methylase UbiE
MFLNPEDTIKHLSLHEDSHVADLGAGSGVYTLAAAKCAPAGRVYAVDINRELLPRIKKDVEAHGYENVEVVWGDIDRIGGTNIRDASMDAVIMANTFFQFENKGAAVQEVKRILKSGGKFLFIDWSGSYGNLGPKEEHIVLPITAKDMFGKAGFAFKENVPAGDYHYGMIFTKK